jgi:hypothetical protein
MHVVTTFNNISLNLKQIYPNVSLNNIKVKIVLFEMEWAMKVDAYRVVFFVISTPKIFSTIIKIKRGIVFEIF